MANVNITTPIFDASEFPIAPQVSRKNGQGGEGFEQFLQKADTASSAADEARPSGSSHPERRSEESRPVSEKSENSANEKPSSPDKSENSADRPAENSGKANEKSPSADSAQGKGATGETGGSSGPAEGASKDGETPVQPEGKNMAELPVGVTFAAGKLAGLFTVLPAGLQQQAEGGDFGTTPLGEALALVMGKGEGKGMMATAPDAPALQGVQTPAGEQAPEISVAMLPTADGQGVSDAAQELLFGGKLPAVASEGDAAEGRVHGPAVAEVAHESLSKGVLPGNGPASTGSGDGSGSTEGESEESGNPIEALLRERLVNASGEQGKTAKAGANLKEQYADEMAPLTQRALQVAYSERAVEVRAALFGAGASGEDGGDGLLDVTPVSGREVGETLGVRSGEGGPPAADGNVSGKNELPPYQARMESRLRHEVQEQIFEAAISRMGIAIRDKVAHARIQLDPPALGRVDMELRVESGMLNARVRVEHGWVKESVESNLKTLRESLREQGVTIEKFTVDVETGSGSGGFGNFFEHERAENPRFYGAYGEEEGVLDLAAVGEPQGYASGGVLTPGSVNLFA